MTIDGDELKKLLLEHDLSIPQFAVVEAKLHPQTVYKAVNGEDLKPRSFDKISNAMCRLRTSSRKSRAAG